MEKKAIIIGAGPAGLTAAYELLTRTDIKPIILEKSGDIGGISKTVNYKGNRIDIGGHRFFSKSDRVMNWWLKMMPIQTDQEEPIHLTYHQQTHEVNPSATATIENSITDPNNRMLVRKRLSRIYFLRKFFSYPIQLSLDTLAKLGLWTTIAIIFSYLCSQLLPRKRERNLEDFMINRFGKVLYQLFFKDYTEKVWGVPCYKISAEWGAQRIKGISISKAIRHALQSATKRSDSMDIRQKSTETSLIEQFLYPMYGPGQMWEEVARRIESMGGTIMMDHDVKRIYTSEDDCNVTAIVAINNATGETSYFEADYFFSTMPVQELIGGLDALVPENVKEVAGGLQYRDFVTVGILLNKMSYQDKKTAEWKPLDLKDTWIYIQEKDVKVGRLQIFNNWSPYMVKDPETVWLGMEFFCATTDDFWNKTDEEIKKLAITELEEMGLATAENVLDATVIRMEKTYPAYFGTYERFHLVREYLDRFKNLFLVGRNGMHKYNNSDHSMLTAMVAVDNIIGGVLAKDKIWEVNTDQLYHEMKDKENPIEEPAMEKKSNVPSFKSFVFKLHLKTILASTILLAIQFFVFKMLYPFANFMPDSYSYLEAASQNSDINIWPIGYSKVLRILSSIVRSDTALALIQYLFLEVSILCFIFTLLYFLNPGYKVKGFLLAFFIVNPLTLNISNYVSADAVFIGFSLLWITLLIWILLRPKPYYIWLQAFTLLILFTIRYNALYYPVITSAVLLLARIKWWHKAAGILCTFSLIISFVWHTENKYKDLTGTRQFSAFGGWQLASNALFMYSRINEDQATPPEELKQLHNVTKKHMDSLRYVRNRPDSTLGIYYLWDEKSPLKVYMENKWAEDSAAAYLKKWANMAPLYSHYGAYLIGKYPWPFIKYYVLPNFYNYIVPPVEFLGMYNMKKDSVKQLAATWFGYKNMRVRSYVKETKLFNTFSVLTALSNMLFICSTIGFTLIKGFKRAPSNLSIILILIFLLWLSNVVFSVLASPIVLRYQIFPFVLTFCFSIILFEFILNSENKISVKNSGK